MISSSDILNAKVLIVDNEEVSVLLLERLLRGAGYVSITSTTDPGEVCALHRSDIKTLTPALINRAGQLEDAGKPALYRNAVETSQNGLLARHNFRLGRDSAGIRTSRSSDARKFRNWRDSLVSKIAVVKELQKRAS